MAKKGFLYVVVGKLDTATGKYSDGRYMGPTSTFNITTTSNDVKDYGDNRAVETDTSVTGGTVSLEINEMTNEGYAYVLGHTFEQEDNLVKCNCNDIAPFLGIGAVGITRNAGKDSYTAKVYKKVQFKEPNDENATQQDSLTFTHTTIEGNMFVPEDGGWKEQKTFETLKEAKAWLNELFTITTDVDGSME